MKTCPRCGYESTRFAEFSATYVNARNKLIPRAEELTNQAVGFTAPQDAKEAEKWRNDWSRTFLENMTQLATESGI